MLLNFILPQFIVKVEKWKWNSEYRVYVSNLGHFKNEHKQLLPIKVNQKGYCLIKTEVGLKLAHRIVMLTWKPIPNAEELTVDHLDHNKRNNCLENLEWVSKIENQARAISDFVKIDLDNGKIIPKIKLQSGQLEFSSYEEAAVWIIANMQDMENVAMNKIVNRIKNAAMNNKKYCGRKWKVTI